MSAPDVLVVALSDERPVGGRLEAIHELGCAELRAELHARGLRADQLVEREVTTIGALASAVVLRGARLVVVATGGTPEVAAALADDLGSREPGPQLELLGKPRAGDAAGLAVLAGAGEHPARAGPARAGTPPSPWLLGLLPARAAARVGVRADSAPERLGAELGWIERRSPLAQVVALHGTAAWADAAAARERVAAIERAELSYVRVAPRLDPRTTGADVAAALARAGAATIVLVVEAAAGEPDLGPIAELARSGAGTDVEVELRLSGDPEHDEAWIAALARSGLPFDTGEPAGVVPELQRARSFRARAADAAQPPRRLRHALEGDAPAAARVVDHAVDVLWSHPEDPGRHAGWLRDVLGASSSLTVLRPGSRPAPVAPPAPLRQVTTVGVEQAGRDGAATWHVDGEVWHVRPYADAPTADPMRPLVLTLERPEDLDAFVADADAAHATGRPPAAVTHPLVTIAGLTAFSADDPGPTLAQLRVEADGLVRSAPAARPIGRLGDPFGVLRAAAFERRDRLDALAARTGGVAAASLPAWLGDDGAVSLLVERGYLRVLADLPRALRALTRPREPPPALGDVRVAGLGGPLAYDGPADPRRRGRRLIVCCGERYAICDRRGGRSLVVGRDLAAISEGLQATGDVATVTGWLAAARGLPPAAAGRAVSTAVGRLRSAGLLDPAELVALPSAPPARATGATEPRGRRTAHGTRVRLPGAGGRR